MAKIMIYLLLLLQLFVLMNCSKAEKEDDNVDNKGIGDGKGLRDIPTSGAIKPSAIALLATRLPNNDEIEGTRRPIKCNPVTFTNSTGTYRCQIVNETVEYELVGVTTPSEDYKISRSSGGKAKTKTNRQETTVARTKTSKDSAVTRQSRSTSTTTSTTTPSFSSFCQTDFEFISDSFNQALASKPPVIKNRRSQLKQKPSPDGKKQASLTSPTVCDVTLGDDDCPVGFRCQKVPSLLNSTCRMGFCRLADSETICALSALSLSQLTESAGHCNNSSECYTRQCLNGLCSCPDGQRAFPFVDYDWHVGTLVRREMCVPTSERAVPPGKPCFVGGLKQGKDGTGKNRHCAAGSICGRCPEFIGNLYINSTCIPINFPDLSPGGTGTNKTGPANDTECQCGYLAKCSKVGNISICTCPPGYNLEENGLGCYGWKVTNISECSKTCGFGVQTINRFCDQGSNSSAACEGSEVKTSPCVGGDSCPIDSNLVPVSVLVKFGSTVLTVDIFDQVLEKELIEDIAEAVNHKCLSDKSVYEQQCCPGKAWPDSSSTLATDCVDNQTGVIFMNKFTNGTVFSFYLMVKGDSKSACCKAGLLVNVTVSTNVSKSDDTKKELRSRRAAAPPPVGAFDQDSVAEIITDPDTLAQMSSTVGQVDPYVMLTSSSVSLAKASLSAMVVPVPITTTAAADASAVQQSTPRFLDVQDGFPVWGVGLFVGGIAIAIAGGVAGAVIFIYKRKKANAAKRQPSAIPERQAAELRRQFVLSFDATHQPLERDTYYPSYYGAYPSSSKSNTRSLIARSAHEVATVDKVWRTPSRASRAAVAAVENSTST